MEREKAIEILEHNWTSLHNPDYTYEELGQALDVAMASLKTDEAYQLEYERPGECKAEDITEEQVVTYLHYHGMMAVSKELWHAMYDEMIKNGVTVEEQQGEYTKEQTDGK